MNRDIIVYSGVFGNLDTDSRPSRVDRTHVVGMVAVISRMRINAEPLTVSIQSDAWLVAWMNAVHWGSRWSLKDEII